LTGWLVVVNHAGTILDEMSPEANRNSDKSTKRSGIPLCRGRLPVRRRAAVESSSSETQQFPGVHGLIESK